MAHQFRPGERVIGWPWFGSRYDEAEIEALSTLLRVLCLERGCRYPFTHIWVALRNLSTFCFICSCVVSITPAHTRRGMRSAGKRGEDSLSALRRLLVPPTTARPCAASAAYG